MLGAHKSPFVGAVILDGRDIVSVDVLRRDGDFDKCDELNREGVLVRGDELDNVVVLVRGEEFPRSVGLLADISNPVVGFGFRDCVSDVRGVRIRPDVLVVVAVAVIVVVGEGTRGG